MNWKMGPIGRRNGGLLVPSMLPLVVYTSSHLPVHSATEDGISTTG